MKHVLENPAWNALTAGNQELANGNDFVKYFDKEVSPFAGLIENTAENFALLYNIIPANRPVLFVATQETEIPSPWKVLNYIKGLQMVYDINTDKPEVETQADIVPLTAADIPQMLDLTKLTSPGPFEARTIAFGHYHGVFDNNKLVAMAGQRLHCLNHAEISAVCTHPDYLGKGYARQLLMQQVTRIIKAGETPFLHVRYNNDRAVKVYQSLGFYTRTYVHFYVIQKQGRQ
jgi:predicted GNAT family acetyltransferase